MINIEKFNLVVSEVLALCYKNFPKEIDISYHQIAYQVTQYYESSEFQDSPEELQELCKDTLTWLEQAGYLWVSFTLGESKVTGVRLSPKALELMCSMPESLSHNESIGDILLGGVRNVSKQSILGAIQVLLSQGVKYMV